MVADRISVRGKIVAAIGVISAVLLLLFGAVLGVGGFARAEEPTAGAYTEIAAVYDGPAVYPETTGADIKSGITVTGTKSDGKTETVPATAYTVKNGGAELADDYKFGTEAGGTLSLTVELISDTTKTVAVSVEVKAAASYTSLRVAAKSGASFTTDLTADKLNSATYFTVEGSKDGATWTAITDYSLLSVEISGGRLKPNQTNGVTFTYLPTGITGNASVYCGAAANLVSATAAVIYTDMKDGYYVTPDGDSAFTTGMTVDRFLSGISITVKYSDNEYVLDLRHNSGTNTFIAVTGETVTVSGYNSSSTDISGVTVSVATEYAPDKPVSVELPEIQVEREKIVGLVVETDKINVADLKSSTSTSNNQFRARFSNTTKVKYNHGGVAVNYIAPTALSVEGNLAPSGEDLIKGLANSDYKYKKSVTLTYRYTENGESKSVSEQVSLTVGFEKPSEISSIDGDIAQQKSFTTAENFDYSGLTAMFAYSNNSVAVPLTELKDYCGVTFSENGTPVSALSVKVSSITVSVNISDYQASQEFELFIDDGGQNWNVSGIEISPNFNASNIVYNPNDCSRDLSFESSGHTVTGLSVNVTTLEGTGSGSYTDGKVSFTSSGKYKVTVELTEFGDFVFGTLSGDSGAHSESNYKIYYEITVDKAQIILSISGSDTRKYGDQYAPTYTLSAQTANGSPVELLGEAGTDDKAQLPVYTYMYYKMGSNPSAAKAEMPKDVGTYNVYIHTDATEWYESADSQAASFVIEKKPISTASVASPTFDKDATAYDASSFIDTTQLVYNDAPSAVFATPVVTDVTGIASDVPAEEITTLFHAGTYTVNIALSASAFENYCWDGATGNTKTLTFTIQKRSVNVSVTVAQDLVYGETSNDPNPSITVTDTKNEGYIDFGSAYYYAGYTSGVPTGTPMASPAWASENAGTYAVYYKDAAADNSKKVYSSDITVTGDYYKSFPIAKANIAKFTQPADPNFKFNNADQSVSLGGYDKKYKDIFTVTVSGTLMSDTTAAVGMSFDYETGKIIVRDAGWYSVKIAFKADNTNYQWSDGTRTDVAFTNCISVAKKKISPSFDKTDPIQFGFTGEGQAPVPTLVVDGHTFTFTTTYLLGGGASGNPELKDGKPYKAGSYWIRLSALACADTVSGGTYSVVKNYEFDYNDGTYFDKAFTILSAQLPKLTLDTDKTSQVYKGKAFTLAELITTWLAGDGTNTYSIDQLKIVSVTSSKVADNNNVAMRDVATYTISVKPNTNYEWASGAAASKDATVELTFTVTKADIIIEWNDSYEHVYDGAVYKISPTLTVIDGSGDVVSPVVEYKKRNADKTDSFATATVVSEAKDAGWYFAYVGSLNGAAKDNYKIPDSGFYKDFVIKKQVIKSITNKKSTTKPTFGDGGYVTFSSDTDGWKNIVSVSSIRRILLDEWVTTTPQYAVVDNSCYDGTTGIFTYVDAGMYNITFKLGEYSNNYCFMSDKETDFTAVSGNGYTHTYYAFVTVERKELTAPKLGDKRAMQYSAVSNFDFGSVDGLTSDKYKIMYGKGNDPYTDETDSTSNLYTIDDKGTVPLSARGKYYVVFKITEKPYNYVWKIDTTDNKGSGYITGLGKTVYTAESSEVYLHYAIINQSLDIVFAVNANGGYTFGDNGYGGSVTLESAIVSSGSEIGTIETEKAKNGFKIVYEFSKVTGSAATSVGTVTKTWSDVAWQYAVTGDLVNNLVWDQGDYTVTVSVIFGRVGTAEPDFEDLTFSDMAFKVKPREITVEWRAGDSAVSYDEESKRFVSVYDGAEHNLVATVTNVAKKTDADTADVTVTVGLNGMTSLPKNASDTAYSLIVKTIEDNADGNYVLPTGGLSARLKINKRIVHVSAVEVTGHIYGEDILQDEKKWKYTGGESAEEKNEFIEADGDVVTVTVSGIDKTTSVGTYQNAFTVKTSNNNYQLVVTNASFTVVARKITVTLKSNGYVVYGNAPTLYVDTYTATLTDGQKIGDGTALTGDAIVNNDAPNLIFTLGLEGVTDVTSTSIAADIYTLTAVKGSNGNYDVTFVKDGETYIIAKADITAPVINVYGGANGAEYDAAYHGILLDTSTATVVNGTTENPLTWDVRDEDANRWVKYDPDEKHRVKDVGDYVYKFKISAPNHYDLVIGGYDAPTEFTVKVKKAEVTVAVNIAITYSEDNPADRDYKMTLDDLKAENGIYTFGTFKGSDNISNIDELALVAGQKLYTIPSYTAVTSSANVDGYAIVFNENALTSKNYTFKGSDGTLTVNKFAFTVKINNLSSTYYTAYRALGSNKDNSSLPDSIYGGKLDGATLGLHNLYELACSELVKTEDNKYTTGVGKYDIVGTQKDESKTNYTITFVNADDSGKEHGVYTITPATMTLTATGYNEVYDENSHALIDTSVTTVDRSVASLVYHVSETQLNAAALAALEDDAWTGDVPNTIDVWAEKYIYVRATESNHATEYAEVTSSVTKATVNTIVDFDFANGTVKTSLADIVGAAWTYGKLDTDSSSAYHNPNGYDGDGNQKATEPRATFSRTVTNNVVGAQYPTVTVYNGDTALGMCVLDGQGTPATVNDLIAAIFAAGKFGAGDYRVTVKMAGTENYAEIDKTYYFRVAKKQLTVEANNVKVVYGEDIAAGAYIGESLGYTVSGLVHNGAKNEELADAINGDVMPLFATEYKKGYENGSVVAGGYDISITNETAVKTSDNYEITVRGNTVDVEKRIVTIKIDDRTNTYNLRGNETAQTLSFDAVSVAGSYGFYDDKNDVIMLNTDALTPRAGKNAKTNDVRVKDGEVIPYPVYATFKTYGDDNTSFDNNYVIKFSGCTYSESAYGVIDDENAIRSESGNFAGSFTIEQATLDVTRTTNPGGVYDGTAKPLVVEATGDEGNVSFNIVYKDEAGLTMAGAPVEVGTYSVTYSLADTNYIASGTTTETFYINKGTLTVTVSNAKVQYGTQLDKDGHRIESGSEVLFTGVGASYAFSQDGEFKVGVGDVTADNIAQKIIDRETDKGTLDLSKLYFKYGGYTVRSTPSENAYKMSVNFNGADAIPSKNYNIVMTTDSQYCNLTVIARNVTITVHGYNSAKDGTFDYAAEGLYTGLGHSSDITASLTDGRNTLNSYFTAPDGWSGQSGDTLNDLKFGLSLETAERYIVGYYRLTASYNNGNYRVSFVYNDDSQGSYYRVKPVPITAYARGLENGEYKDVFKVTYGDNVRFAVAFTGFVNGETYDALVSNGAATGEYVFTTAYESWVKGIGNYTVKTSGSTADGKEPWFRNYEITEWKDVTFEVVQRVITANTPSDRVYDEERNGDGTVKSYNGGAYGATLEAIMTFGNIPADKATDYYPVYSDTYGGKGTTPNRVGTYTLTVKLKEDGNYKFENGYTYTYNTYRITKKPLNIGWAPSSINVTDLNSTPIGDKTARIDGFIEELMTFGNSGFMLNTGSGAEIVKTDAYTMSNSGLTLIVWSNGTYTAHVKFNDTAAENYEFTHPNAPNGTMLVSLVVTSQRVDLSVEIVGWIYGETENSPIGRIGGSVNNTIEFTYASSAADYDSLDESVKSSFTDVSLLGLLGVAANDFTSKNVWQANAGTHIVCGYYRATGQSAYFVFVIEKKEINAPTFTVNADNDTYTGSQLELAITLDRNAVTVTANDCAMQNVAGGVALYATNAKTYAITFGLASGNYKWSASAGAEGGVVKASWTVKKAAGEVVSLEQDDITYGDRLNPAATAKFGANVAFGYKAVTKAEYDAGAVKPADETSGWQVTAQVHTEYGYWVRAVSADTDNYSSAVKYGRFEIAKKTVHVTAYGTFVYGETFSATGAYNHYRFDSSDFVLGNNESRISVEESALRYELDNNNAKLPAGTYGITLATDDDGYVIGMTADNYVVVPATVKGEFSVTKRPLSVTIGNAQVYYSLVPDLTGVTLTADALAFDDTVAMLGIRLTTAANDRSNVGSYIISAASSTTNNYDITYTSGICTVAALPVSVNLTAGGGEFGGTVTAPQIGSPSSTVSGVDMVRISGELSLTFRYVGTSFGNVAWDSDEMPEAAGRYTARLTGVGSNFVLTDTPSAVDFVITKKTIDQSRISVKNAVYDETNHTPEIVDALYGGFYTVGSGVYINAGTHQVYLTLKNADNTEWNGISAATCSIPFVIEKANNEIIGGIIMSGWTYGDEAVAPQATTKYGTAAQYTWRYYDASGKLLGGVPATAGSYSVSLSVPEGDNYNALAETRVTFAIAKFTVTAPTLTVVEEGDDKNDVYTGGELYSAVVGFNNALMSMHYDGSSRVNGDSITLIAVNAGTYNVTFALLDGDNYAWDGFDGDVVRSWTIARKKIAKPSDEVVSFIVSGKPITFIPDGFDGDTMAIDGNVYGYGGTFTATVTLRDPSNYEWEDGTQEPVERTWKIVGANVVFNVVVGVLSGLSAVAAGVAVWQVLAHRRKKRLVEQAMNAMDAEA